jgi:hypothetical protein
MSGITEPGEYPQPDGSVLSVARPEKGVNAGKLIGNLYSKEDLTRQANEEAYASWPQQITSNVDAEQAQLLSFADQAANPNLRQNVLRDMRQEDKDYIEKSLAEGGTPQQIIDAYIIQKKSPEDAARMVNAVAGPTPLSTEEAVPTVKEFEPSSGGSDQLLEDAGLVQKDAAITEQAPVEITGQTPDTELMRFLEANGLTSDEAQKVLISGKAPTQDAGTDYNKFFELSPEGTPTPKVVVQGQTPPKDTAVDDLMALLGPYDTQLDNTQRVDITGNTPKEGVSTDLPSALLGPTTSDEQEANRVEITAKKLLQDMGLDLGAYNEGPVVAPDKLTDTQEIVIRDKLKDELPWEDPWMPPVVPGEETPPEVNPEEPVVDPTKPVVKPVIKPVVDPKRPGVPTTTDPGASYTIPGTTTQLHQELMNLPETDILRMLNPALYAYKDAQKRKKPSGDDQMMALLNELGYRS